MKRRIHTIAFAVFFLFLMPLGAEAAEFLIPGGQVIGLQLQNGTVTVAAFDDILGAAARDSGIQIGDEILTVEGQTVSCAEDIRRILERTGTAVNICVNRSGKQHTLQVDPQQTEAGPRLGIHLKQGITGIGTVTWYDPETKKFGTLGHGVHDADGHLLNMTAGTAYHAQVIAVRKGLSGEPGLLKGNADIQDICGSLFKNTSQGVFGTAANRWMGQAVPVAKFEDIRTGDATIRSTVGGTDVQEYSVEILKIYPQERKDSRNFLIKITDPELLGKTGGIVQGMSGSPIIQNGKLVGAVTHVLVNDPTRGYGIFIENMLDAAG